MFVTSLQYLKKEGRDEVGFFFMQINIKLSCKLVLSILLGMATYGRSIQNNRFAKSLQYLKKEVSDEADFLHIDEHQKFSAN